jgi:N-acyl-D-aspartate/D-glutamate deacylase
VEIGALSTLPAAREIDAAGKIVSPGFVDMHSHADLVLLGDEATQRRLLAAKIGQGVTTIVVGNCGLGVAPSTEESAPILSDVNGWMTPEGVRGDPMGIDEYLGQLESGGVALNVATLIPHGPLRISAMGLTPGPPDESALSEMIEGIGDGMAAGAFGLSTGLIYPPGMYSATDELSSLASALAPFDGLFTSHVRGSSETLLAATDELIAIGRNSGVRVHHSHLEAVGERFWPSISEVLSREAEARKQGLRISHDVFPYTRAATMMAAIFPPWSLEGGVPALLDRLADPGVAGRIRNEIETRVPEWPPWKAGGWPHNLVGAVGWDGILVASVGPDGPGHLVGRSLAEIADAEGRHPFEVVSELMLSQNGQVGQQVAEISGREGQFEGLLRILSSEAAAVITDAEDYGRGAPHPAHAGAFARALRWNRDHRLMPVEQMVRRMTGYPASLVGIESRGTLRIGAAADVVVFEPETVSDAANWTDPRERASGIDWVMLNGEIVVEQGRYVGGLVGRVLRSTREKQAG